MDNEIVIETYKPNPTPVQYHTSKVKFRFLTGPVGSSKSRSSIEEVTKQILLYPNNVFYILRNTYPELKDSTITDFKRFFNPKLLRYPDRWDKSYNQVDHNLQTVNGGMIKFRSADHPEKFQSVDDMGGFLLVECADIAEDTFLFLSSRPRRTDIPFCGLLEGYVPDNRSWVYRLFWLSGDPDYQMWNIPQRENAHNLRTGYYEDLYKAYAHKPNWIARYLEAKVVFLSLGVPMYSMFDERIHVIDDFSYQPELPLIVGQDYGYHYPAITFSQYWSDTDQWVILGSMFFYNVVAPIYAQKARAKMVEWFGNVPHEDYGDPAGAFKSDKTMNSKDGTGEVPATTMEMIAQFGWNPQFRRSYVGEGIDMIRKQLLVRDDGSPGLLIVRNRNQALMEAFMGGYCTKKDSEDPDDTAHPYVDLMDALRYPALFILPVTYQKKSEREEDNYDSGMIFGHRLAQRSLAVTRR